MVNQKTGVVNAILALFPNYEIGGEVILKSILTKAHKDELKTVLCTAFKAGEISMSDEAAVKYLQGDEDALRGYVGGLLDNWVRKHPGFNNNFPETAGIYAAKNPGSRAGSKDDQIVQMRALKKLHVGNTEVLAEIDAAIAARIALIKPVKTVEIDASLLPESLRQFAPNAE